MMHKPRREQWVLLLSLMLIWGTSYILIKKALIVYQPLQLAALRMVFSMLCCLPFLPKAIKNISVRDYWKVVATGLLASGVPAFLFAYAMTKTSSAMNGIINSLSPLFTVITGALIWKVAITPRKVAGVFIGLAGAVVLVMGRSGWQLSGDATYALFPMVATLMYGMNSNFIKQHFAYANAIEVTAMAMLFLGGISLPLLFFTDTHQALASPFFWKGTACLFALSFFGTVIGWILYYRLVQQTDALFAASVTYLIPLMAIGWGLVDGEQLEAAQLLGLALILGGVYFVTKK